MNTYWSQIVKIFAMHQSYTYVYRTVIDLKSVSDRLYIMYTTPKDLERVQRPHF